MVGANVRVSKRVSLQTKKQGVAQPVKKTRVKLVRLLVKLGHVKTHVNRLGTVKKRVSKPVRMRVRPALLVKTHVKP